MEFEDRSPPLDAAGAAWPGPAMSGTARPSPLGLLTATANLRGIALMIVARIVFAASDTFTKLASEGLPSTEVVSVRNSVALPIVLFMAWRLGALRHTGALRDSTVLSRSVLEGAGTLAFVAALPHVMIGQSTVILLTVPIILVALSAILFKEDVGWRRWTAIVVGFIGVFLVAGPLGGAPNVYLLLTQFTAVVWAIRDLVTSRIDPRIPSVMVTVMATAVVSLLGLPGALAGDWTGFGGQEAMYLAAAGAFQATANFLYITALRTGAVSVVAPFRYTAALWATVAGFMVWGDVPDAYGVAGTLLIIGSGLYTFYRELEVAKKRRAAKA
jgi:drug/metabolite transporter (DMT)-like permease